MSYTTADGITYTVGQPILTRGEFHDLPAGTTIRWTRRGWRYTKNDDGTWTDLHSGTVMNVYDFTLAGANVIDSFREPERPRVGTVINDRRQLDLLPTGTVLIAPGDPNNSWEVTEGDNAGRHLRSLRYKTAHYLSSTRCDSFLQVQSLPSSTISLSGWTPASTDPPRRGHLRFVSSGPDWSVYLDGDGEEVILANGDGHRLLPFDKVWPQVSDLWDRFKHTPEYWMDPKRGFTRLLKALTFERGVVDEELRFCLDCTRPQRVDDLVNTERGTRLVCSGCFEANYHQCSDCSGYFRPASMFTTGTGVEVCSRCCSANWLFCSECDGYYHRTVFDTEHKHGRCDDDCEAPRQVFSMRNDGQEPLRNDTRVTVALPAGQISDVGIGQMATCIQQWALDNYPLNGEGSSAARQKYNALSFRLSELGSQWQTKRGNFTKRLSRFAHEEYQIKLPPEVISQIGNIGRDHSGGSDFQIEITRNLNLPRHEFFHGESCWWTDYSASRCALKSNGGFGLRSFGDRVPCECGDDDCDEYTEVSGVSGRAWVMPLRLDEDENLQPTFNTTDPDAFVVFNGYGALTGYIPARIIAHMAGMTYCKVGFDCDPMYINNDVAYLVGPEALVSDYTDGGVSLTVERHSNLFESEGELTNA